MNHLYKDIFRLKQKKCYHHNEFRMNEPSYPVKFYQKSHIEICSN